MTFKELLENKQHTQQKLANAVGVTQIAVSKWVRGVAVPTKANMLKIADALNVDAIDIIKLFYN